MDSGDKGERDSGRWHQGGKIVVAPCSEMQKYLLFKSLEHRTIEQGTGYGRVCSGWDIRHEKDEKSSA